MTRNVVATSECGYAFRLTFCHSANKYRYAQIISGFVPDTPAGNLVQDTDFRSVKAYEKFRKKMVKLSDTVFTYDFTIYFTD